MTQEERKTGGQLIAELNDLLQLDHDAVQAYSLAIDGLRNEEHRQTLIRFRSDHDRHIGELSRLIQSYGGTPVDLPHLPSGAFKSAVQAAGSLGSDREVLLAFKANEGQVREKYRRIAQRDQPQDVAEILTRNAADEDVHYQWVSQVLTEMGAGPDTPVGKAEEVFERVHGAAANLSENVERRVMGQFPGGATGLAGDVRRWVTEAPLRAIGLGLAAGLIVRRILR